MRNIFLYPIKLLLKRKVAKYENLLKELKKSENSLKVKSRRTGMVSFISLMVTENIKRQIKVEKFKNKWKLK